MSTTANPTAREDARLLGGVGAGQGEPLWRHCAARCQLIQAQPRHCLSSSVFGPDAATRLCVRGTIVLGGKSMPQTRHEYNAASTCSHA